jgi:hypothetical protein
MYVNPKMIPVESIKNQVGGRGIKENGREGEVKYNILDIL